MARKSARKVLAPPDFSSFVDEVTAVPRSFIFGLVAGLLVPVAAIGGIVAGVYLFTRKVPFVAEIKEEDEERHLIVKLVQPEEARSLFQSGRKAVEAFGDEIRIELEADQ